MPHFKSGFPVSSGGKEEDTCGEDSRADKRCQCGDMSLGKYGDVFSCLLSSRQI